MGVFKPFCHDLRRNLLQTAILDFKGKRPFWGSFHQFWSDLSAVSNIRISEEGVPRVPEVPGGPGMSFVSVFLSNVKVVRGGWDAS